ncbi:hypothetical protein FQN52_001246 [Onygenales sp. PD_12]|nr:hypothetical protein FQN52_001246 [Onygenales sp. PD_12]
MWACCHRRFAPSSLNFASVRFSEHRAHSGFRGWSQRDSPPVRYHCSGFPAVLAPSAPTQQASSLWTLAVSALVVFGGLGVRHIYTGSYDSDTPKTLSTPEVFVFEKEEMSADPQLTGRVGNLTEEEEVKLKEFWALLFKIFKVGEESSPSLDGLSLQKTISSTVNTTDTASVVEKKKTKRRWGLFGRYTETVEEEETTSKTTNSVADQVKLSDDDDKYGLNKEFYAALASQSPDELRHTFWNAIKHDHPDALVLRFLRARKWDVSKALVMLVSTLRWRSKEWNVDEDIVKKGEAMVHEKSVSSDPTTKKEGQDMLQMLRVGEAYCRGKDKLGQPICYIKVRLHRIGTYCQSAIEKNIIFHIETSRLMLDSTTDTAVLVFDMTDFGLANMDYVPVKFIIKCFEANYPESLGAVLVHKAPWIFSSFWAIIKGWLDPVVAAKVHFTNNFDELQSYIPKDQIPNDLGGSDDYEYQYIEPKAGENDLLKDTAKAQELTKERFQIVEELQKATLSWLAAPKTDADKNAEIKKEREEICKRLGDFYWKIDPYVRARSIYDRIKDEEDAKKKAEEPAAAPAAEPTPVSEKQETAKVVDVPAAVTAAAAAT